MSNTNGSNFVVRVTDSVDPEKCSKISGRALIWARNIARNGQSEMKQSNNFQDAVKLTTKRVRVISQLLGLYRLNPYHVSSIIKLKRYIQTFLSREDMYIKLGDECPLTNIPPRVFIVRGHGCSLIVSLDTQRV